MATQFTPTIELATGGKVRGQIVEADSGRKAQFFQGIRFGQAARFEKPQFPPVWDGVYDATKPRDSCPQPEMQVDPEMAKRMKPEKESEDCLFLNVWRPNSTEKNLPVMVYIHGGAFVIGSIFTSLGSDFRRLSSRGEMVVVSINYRLGVFGFMAGVDGISPNLGLHDQILALNWVKKNIAAFGGDPAQVTIFGTSAGSMSVGLLALSPLSKGLFRRAIMHGGSSYNSFWCTSLERAAEKTRVYVRAMGVPDSVPLKDAIEILKKKTSKELNKENKMDLAKMDFFVPTYGDELLPLSPIEALQLGKLPNPEIDLLVSCARDEGSSFVIYVYPKILDPSTLLTPAEVREDITKMMGEIYGLKKAEEIGDFYTKNLKEDASQNELRMVLAAPWGDFHLATPTFIYADLYARHAPKNNYFAYRQMQVLGSFGTAMPEWFGVTHAQDSGYFFFADNLADERVANGLERAAINFAKTGKVGGNFGLTNVEWQGAVDPNGTDRPLRYLSLDMENLKMDSEYSERVCRFWRERIVK